MTAVLDCACVCAPVSRTMAAIRPCQTLSLHSRMGRPDLHTWLPADTLTGGGSMRVFTAAPNLCCMPLPEPFAPDLPVQVG